MKLRFAKAPKSGFYFIKGEYGWWYGLNLWFFHFSVHPGTVTYERIAGKLVQHRHFIWRFE